MADAEAEKPFETFKIPQLITPKDPATSSTVDCESSSATPESDEGKISQKSDSQNTKLTSVTKTRTDVPLPYKEPTWSGTPPNLYSLEIIKNGTFIEVFSIKNSLVVFGRLDVCDLAFEHPSVSRYHAIIQYCQGDSAHAQGFYLYDLGSTHGTFLNKDKITPKVYYKLKVGYILKFGGSSRLHIFQGPEAELEDNVEKPMLPKVEEPMLPKVEETCSWGITEDAEEDDDMSENPFALSTPNEELYLEDPKKTLRGWFEREGYELEYNVEEKGFKTFACRIQLPIDTPTGDFMTVEASVSGKKKEAVIACALEGCRTLDRLGLLRQSHQEGRQRRKKKWEENDYYDSDEDTFLDRTGSIEKKREMRKRIEKKPEAETFKSIENKLKIVTDEINEITGKLSVCKKDNQGEKSTEDDSLEAYMSTLSDSKDMASDKIERRKLKYRLVQAEKEKLHLEKLLEIARPTKLPPAAKYPGMIGKRLKSKLQKFTSNTKEKIVLKLNENEEEVEEDSDSEVVSLTKVPETTAVLSDKDNVNEDVPKTKSYGLILNVNAKKDDKIVSDSDNKMVIDVDTTIPTQHKKPKEMEKPDIIPDSMSEDVSVPKKRKRNKQKQVESSTDVYKTESAEYSTWMPPTGQTGDGMTHLNSKYGY